MLQAFTGLNANSAKELCITLKGDTAQLQFGESPDFGCCAIFFAHMSMAGVMQWKVQPQITVGAVINNPPNVVAQRIVFVVQNKFKNLALYREQPTGEPVCVGVISRKEPGCVILVVEQKINSTLLTYQIATDIENDALVITYNEHLSDLTKN